MENIDAKGRNTSFLENSAQESGNLEVAGEFVLPEHLDDAKKIARQSAFLQSVLCRQLIDFYTL